MSVRSESEVLAELEVLLHGAVDSLNEAKECLEAKNRQDCTDACIEAQQKVQQALSYLMGFDKPNLMGQ